MSRVRFFQMVVVLSTAALVRAEPVIVSLGTGIPLSVTDNLNTSGGEYYIAGGTSGNVMRWTFDGSSVTLTNMGVSGSTAQGYLTPDGVYQVGCSANTNTAANPNVRVFGYVNTNGSVSPPFSTTPTLAMSTTLPGTSENCVWRYNGSAWNILGGPNGFAGGLSQNVGFPLTPSLMVFGSGSGTFMQANAISANGRFIVGRGYISTYNSSAGTTISANSGHWRPFIWDAQANSGAGGFTILTTPMRTASGQTWRRRTGDAYCVSEDGTVVLGVQEHNIGAGANTNDPDGCRPIIWRWNSGTSQYDMTYLPDGTTNGFPYTAARTPGKYAMNKAGTIIVGAAIQNDTGLSFLGKWLWNGTSWDPPINLGSDLVAPPSWLPTSVPNLGLGDSVAMSDDGSVVVGQTRWPLEFTWSSGFIWRASDNTVRDWYDYCVNELGMTDITTNYSPLDITGSPTPYGLPRLGFPTAVSPDGSAFVGYQGGTTIVIGAVPWMLMPDASTNLCAGPSVVTNPTATQTFSRCTGTLFFNARGNGTLPITYQWRKNGNNLSDGATGNGSNITGAQTIQMRIIGPNAGDAGSYDCLITGACGSPVATAASVVSTDGTVPAVLNDTCTNAMTLSGSLPLVQTLNPCGAYVDDALGAACTNSIGDVWYSFTPPSTADYRFESCNSTITTTPNTSNYNTVISVFTDCSGGEIICNNDYDTGPTRNCGATQSRVSRVTLTGGVPVLIRVGGVATNLGNSSYLRISLAPPAAANDACTNAQTAALGANTFDFTEATNDGSATCNTNSGTRDVWFTYTPTATGALTLSTCDTTTIMDTAVAVFDACGGNQIGCNDTAVPAGTGCSANRAILKDVPVAANSLYYIRVSAGTLGTMGTNLPSAIGGKLTLSLVPMTITSEPDAQDLCAGSAFDMSVTASGATQYQWRRNGVPLVDGADITGATTEGATTSHLEIHHINEYHQGNYDCGVSNGAGTLYTTPKFVNIWDSCLKGDMNCDDAVTAADVPAFVQALLNGTHPAACNFKNADLDHNGIVDGRDIRLFMEDLLP